MKPIAFLLSTILLLSSCIKDQSTASIHPNTFVFGYCRACPDNRVPPGKCFMFYEIKANQLYADSMRLSGYPGPEVFSLVPLGVGKYQAASALINSFPVYLLNNPNTVYGNTDCDTHWTLHIECTENGQVKTWDIDHDTTNLPHAIRAYVAQMNSVFDQLIQ